MESLSPKKKNFLFIVAIIILTSLISFFLGRLSVLDTEEEKVQIYYPDVVKSIVGEGGESSKVFASKSGTKYYFEWCSSSVKEANKVYFNTKEKAENAGYTLASGCNEF